MTRLIIIGEILSPYTTCSKSTMNEFDLYVRFPINLRVNILICRFFIRAKLRRIRMIVVHGNSSNWKISRRIYASGFHQESLNCHFFKTFFFFFNCYYEYRFSNMTLSSTEKNHYFCTAAICHSNITMPLHLKHALFMNEIPNLVYYKAQTFDQGQMDQVNDIDLCSFSNLAY